MSLSRLDAVCPPRSPACPYHVSVWAGGRMDGGWGHALQRSRKPGWRRQAVAGRTMLFVQYEEERPDALSPHNTAATPGSPVSSCG